MLLLWVNLLKEVKTVLLLPLLTQLMMCSKEWCTYNNGSLLKNTLGNYFLNYIYIYNDVQMTMGGCWRTFLVTYLESTLVSKIPQLIPTRVRQIYLCDPMHKKGSVPLLVGFVSSYAVVASLGICTIVLGCVV